MRTAPEIVRAVNGAQIFIEACGPDRVETFGTGSQDFMDAALARDIEENLTNVLALLLGVYYDDRVNCWRH